MYTEIRNEHHHFKNNVSVKKMHIVVSTAAEIPEPQSSWAVASRCDVLEDGGHTYLLNHEQQWEEVYFFGGEHAQLDMLANYGVKNLLKNTASSTTANGITFTVNADGSVTISGTATSDAYINLTSLTAMTEVGKEYIISCQGANGNAVYMSFFDASYAGVGKIGNTGIKFTETAATRRARLTVANGSDFTEPVTVYPMLRNAVIQDDSYQPYAMTNAELTAKITELESRLTATAEA